MAHLIAPVTSGYGWRTDPNTGKRTFHTGIDENLDQPTPLHAQFEGRFYRQNASSRDDGRYFSYGWYYDLISLNGRRRARAAHLSRFMVANGARVKAGELVALSGGLEGAVGAGNSTGDHVHLEDWVLVNGIWKHRDPTDHLGMLHHPLPEEEDDVTEGQAKQLADVHYTLTNIPDPDGGAGRVPLHVWCAKIEKRIEALEAK